ncbi:hypothetical protein [Ornithinimicrobium sp. CNJ-824]
MGTDCMRRADRARTAYRRGMEWFVADDGWLGRAVLQHALAALYLVAFVAAARQGPALIGSRG